MEGRAGRAVRREVDRQPPAGPGAGVGGQVVRQRAGRAQPRLLRGQRALRGRHRHVVGVPVVVGRQVAAGVRQRRDGRVGAGEVERGGQVAAHRPPPGRDVRLVDAEPALDQADDRGVVEDLRADIAAPAPRRDHQHRDPLAQSVRAGRLGRAAGGPEQLGGGVRGGPAPRGRGRRSRRHDVVEEAVVLVVGDQQGGAAPHVRVRRQGVQDLRDVPGAVVHRPVGVLGERLGRHDPGDLREPPGQHVGLEDVEEALACLGVGAGAGLVVQGGAGRRGAVLVEVEQRVVAVVADVGVLGPAPGAGRVQAVADVLVDLPGDARPLQPLGVRRPGVARLGVGDDRAAAAAVVARPARPQVVAVGVGGAQQRAVVGVADGEGVGQRVVERDVLAGQVRHRGGALGGDPAVVAALVPGGVAAVPVVREVLEELQPEPVRRGPERQDLPGAVRLVPHRPAVRQGHRGGVAEAAHTAQRAEVVVEGAVLLHQDHDVVHVPQSAGPAVRRDLGGSGDAAGQHRHGGCGAAGQAHERATVDLGHEGCLLAGPGGGGADGSLGGERNRPAGDRGTPGEACVNGRWPTGCSPCAPGGATAVRRPGRRTAAARGTPARTTAAPAPRPPR